MGDSLIVTPMLSLYINASYSLFSNMAKIGQINFKGTNFENFIKKMISESGFNCSSIRIGKYECDVIFVICNELFFIECKTHMQPYTIREHTKLRYQIFSEIDKFNKNIEFFLSNLNHIIAKLNLQKKWAPSKVHRIFITSAMLGSYELYEKCHITDSTILITFFLRVRTKIINDINMSAQTYFAKMREEITAEKLMDYIKNPDILEYYLKRCKEKKHIFYLNDYKFEFPGFINSNIDVIFTKDPKNEDVQ